MVKVDIGTMGEQVSSVSSTVSSRVSALESSIQSLNAFNEAGGLQGSAYEGAKSYATGILVPMLQALILYEEALDADTTQNQTAYSSYFSDSKDSAELEADIADFQSAKEAALWTMRVYSEPGNKASQAEKNATKAAYNDAAAGLRDAQEELRQLHEFNERSAQHFTETASLQSTVMSALSQISTQFSSFSAGSGFTAFVNKTPDWAKKVNSEWEKRTKVNDRLKAVNQKLKNGEPLTDKDIKAIRAYQDRYPSKELPKHVREYVTTMKILNEFSTKSDESIAQAIISSYTVGYEAGKISKQAYDKIINSSAEELNILIEDMLNSYGKNPNEVINNILTGVSEEYRDNFLEDMLVNVANAAPAIASNVSRGLSKASIISALGVMFSSAPDSLKNISYNAIEKIGGTSIIATNKFGTLFGKLGQPTNDLLAKIGFESNASLLLGTVAAGVDAWGQIGKGENIVNAAAKGVAHTTISTAIITKTTAIGAVWGTAIPIPGGTLIGAASGLVVGVALSMGANEFFDNIYDNTVGSVVDWAMDNDIGRRINQTATNFVNDTNKAISNTLDNAKEKISDVGEAISSWSSSLGSVFS